MPSILPLPSELTAEVFVQCLEPELWVQNEGLVIPYRDSAPLSLAQVSRDWRATALGMTALWCRLCIDLFNRAGDVHPLLLVWLQRAGERPIHLALDMVKPRELEQLLHRFPTITSLRITAVPPRTQCTVHSAQVNLGSVQNLVLDGDVLDCGGWGSILEQLFAPRLRTLKFRLHTPLLQVLALLRRSNCGHTLTRLSLATAGTSPILLDILCATPSLRILRIDDSDALGSCLTPLPTPALFHLQHADVVPQLADLHIHAGLREEHFPSFLEILQTRSRVLKRVQLNLLYQRRSSRYTGSCRYYLLQDENRSWSSPGPSILAALQVLVAAGLDLSIVAQE